MKKQTVILRDLDILDRVLTLCRMAVDDKKTHEVVIQEHKVNISAQQRKLYFFWIGIICNELGYEKEELHLIMKRRFLVPIYIREHDGFAEMVDALKKVRRVQNEALWSVLSAHILRETSIMDAKVSEMKEYLTCIDRDAAANSIVLPLPEHRDFDKRIWKR